MLSVGTPALVVGLESDSRGPQEDVDLGPILLRRGLAGADEILRIHVPDPTAAFSQRDARQAGFARAAAAVRGFGFLPVIRSPGGRLAVYHGGSIVIDHVHRGPDGRAAITSRFERFAGMHVGVLAELGVDARVGQVPGEYCPGEFSINVGGTHKIVGSAQRVTKDGWLFSTVVQIGGAARTSAVTMAAYDALGYDLDPGTIGALEDFVPEVSVDALAGAFRRAYEADLGPLRPVHLPAEVRAELSRDGARQGVVRTGLNS